MWDSAWKFVTCGVVDSKNRANAQGENHPSLCRTASYAACTKL